MSYIGMQAQPTSSQSATRLQSVLHALVDMTESLTQAIHAQAMAQAAIRPEANAPEHVRDATAARTATLAGAFDRVARTLRRTVLLAHHLDQPGNAPDRRTHARTRIIRGIEDAIDRAAHAGRKPNPEALRRELLERLDSPALDDDLATRPLPDLIEELCRDLNLHYPIPSVCPPRRRTPADIEAARIEAQAPPGTFRTPPGTFRTPRGHDASLPRHCEAPLGAAAIQEPRPTPSQSHPSQSRPSQSSPSQPRPPTAADLAAVLGPPGRRSG